MILRNDPVRRQCSKGSRLLMLVLIVILERRSGAAQKALPFQGELSL